jgi:hypothetical protein
MKIQVLSASEAGSKTFTVLEFPDQGEVVIGRGAECEVCIKDAQSSRRHARIFWIGGKSFVEDMESKNGTRLNGKSIRRAGLANNDQIQIGDTVLTVAGVLAHERNTACIQFRDDPAPVLVTLNQNEPDLLSQKSQLHPKEMERQIAVLQEISRISQLVAGSQDVDTTVSEVLDDILELLSADTACLLMCDSASGGWQVVLSSQRLGLDPHITVSSTIISQARKEGQAILSAHPLSDDRFDPSHSILTQGISSAVCAPIRTDNEFCGVLSLDRRERATAFDETDLRVTATVAGLLSLLLDKERLAMESRQGAQPK